MTDISSTFKLTIISLMIVSGAINTIGNTPITQPTNSKTNKWSTKGNTSNISSIHICRSKQKYLGHSHVCRRIISFSRFLYNEKKRSRRIQNKMPLSQIQRKVNQLQCFPTSHTCHQWLNYLYFALCCSQLRCRFSLPNDARRNHSYHFHVLYYLP